MILILGVLLEEFLVPFLHADIVVNKVLNYKVK